MADRDAAKKEKYTTLNRLLNDEYVLVHINPSVDGLALPPHLKGNPSVTLKLSRLFRGTLKVEKELVSADLLFGDGYFTCLVPFEAVWGVTSSKGNNVIWPESTPPHILEQILAESKTEKPPRPAPRSTTPKKGAHLKRVK